MDENEWISFILPSFLEQDNKRDIRPFMMGFTAIVD
jgi:hypothetical protein